MMASFTSSNEQTLLDRQQAFGYTQEDMAFFLEPMARNRILCPIRSFFGARTSSTWAESAGVAGWTPGSRDRVGTPVLTGLGTARSVAPVRGGRHGLAAAASSVQTRSEKPTVPPVSVVPRSLLRRPR